MLKQEISQLIKSVLQEKGLDDIKVLIDYPADAKNGDYASNAALIAAKKVGKGPMEIAEEISEELRFKNKDLGLFEKIEVAKPGFINFWIAQEKLLGEATERRLPNIGNGRTIVVEYSSPNIAKPFTIGHLRSTIIGDAVANLLEATGWDVKRDNHLGDWGTQFGKQICAIKKWGNEDAIAKSDRPVKLLVDLYVKFHDEAEKDPALEDEAREWFKKLEDGDKEARDLWQKCVDWSWREFETIYQQLDVSFTENGGRGYGEAFFEDRMGPVLDELKDKQLLHDGKEGAKIVDFEESTKLPPLMILKKDGATLYATRDLATDKFRLDKYGKDITIINEVGSEQSLYFEQLFKLEAMLGWVKSEQRVHIKHGLYRFKDGKMSTRKGNVIWLEDVLEEAKKRAAALADENNTLSSDGVGIGAIKWNDLKRDSKQDIAFDWDEILNMQGNSGPYMQYTYTRTRSVLRKSEANTKYEIRNTKYQLEPEERELLRLVVRFEEVVAEAAGRFAPSGVATYLFELAQAFNLFYQKHQILNPSIESNSTGVSLMAGEVGEVRQFRLGLTQATGNVIKQGLNLLGIQAPEKM